MRTLAFLFALIFAIPALAGNPGFVLEGDWTRDDCIPGDGLVADFRFLDAFPEGDILQGAGNMETGAAGGGCTYCPDGFVCTCAGTSNVTQETSKVYKHNASAKYVVDALDSVITILYPFYAEANTAYQISWKHKGNAGGEDFYIQLNDIPANSYNFATDAWQVGASAITYAALPTSWTTTNLYFVNDATARTAYFRIVRNNANFTYYFDDFQIHKLKSTGPRSRAGQYTLQVPVTSDMSFSTSPDLLSKPADGPAGPWGTWFDGVDDFVGCVSATCPWSDAGDAFSVAIEIFRDNNTGTQGYVAKHGGGAEEWILYANPGEDNLRWYVCKAGPTCSNAIIAGSMITNVTHRGVGTYQQISDGASTLKVYLNSEAPDTNAAAVSPIQNSNADFIIGGFGWLGGPPVGPLAGTVSKVSLYDKTLSDIEVSKWINPYFPANNNNRGSYVTTCTQAASHATCSAQKCRDGTPNACQAEATGAMALYGQNTELVGYNSFETVVNDDSNPLFTGYSTLEVNGDGSSDVTAYRDETKHGNVAVRLKSSGSTAYSAVSTVCIAVTPATDYYAYVSAKQLGGTRSNLYLSVAEYSDGACAVPIGVTNLFTGPIDSSFRVREGTPVVTTGATNSVALSVVNEGAFAAAPPTFTGTASSDILVDAISFKAASYFTPWVHNPGAGTTTYNARDYRIRNTLADQTYGGTYPYLTGWCAGTWIYTDWDGSAITVHKTIASVGPTAGMNNYWHLQLENGNYIAFYIYDSAGAAKYVYEDTDGGNWPANSWKYVEWCSDNAGNLKGHWYSTMTSTWFPIPHAGGAGTGIQDGQSANMSVGASYLGTLQLNGFMSSLCFVPYNAVYPHCGWNNGNPPALGAYWWPMPT